MPKVPSNTTAKEKSEGSLVIGLTYELEEGDLHSKNGGSRGTYLPVCSGFG